MGPLTYLAKKSGGEIQLQMANFTEGVSWATVSQVDLVFLHRPCRDVDLKVIQISHNLNIPTWVDYDDWLFGLPGWNPHKANYDSNQMQYMMAQCLASADLVSVSTNQLYQTYKTVNPNIVILPNAYRSDLFKYRSAILEDREPLVYWRGTNTHDGDLMSVRDGFLNLKHKIDFLGGPCWMVLSGMDKSLYSVKPSLEVMSFNRYLYDTKPKVMVFPLVDCLFNRCKSNIAYIEALHAGAICVAPDMPEWQREGVITFPPHDSQAFVQAVNQAMAIPQAEHRKLVESAFESMKSSYDINVVNQLREQVVNHLTGDEFQKNPNNPFDQSVGLKALALLQEIRNRG
jgi:hypothetical protein